MLLGSYIGLHGLMALTKLSKGLLQPTRGIALYSASAIQMLPDYKKSLKEKIYLKSTEKPVCYTTTTVDAVHSLYLAMYHGNQLFVHLALNIVYYNENILSSLLC